MVLDLIMPGMSGYEVLMKLQAMDCDTKIIVCTGQQADTTALTGIHAIVEKPVRLPGLPPDVAAFVDELRPDGFGVRLVNTSPADGRNLIVQAGAFGEHRFVQVCQQAGAAAPAAPSTAINGKHFEVELPPSAAIRLHVGLERFVNRPTYAFPWHGDSVPVALQSPDFC